MAARTLRSLDADPSSRRRRPRAAVALLVAVSLAAAGWSASRLGDDPPSAPPGRPPSRVTPSAVAAARGVVAWEDFAGLELPVSPTAGPRLRAAGRAAGFAHDATGAAFAAIHLLVRTFPFAGSAVFVPTIAGQVEGPDAPALTRLTRDAYAAAAKAARITDGRPLRSDGGWVAGYRLDPPTTGFRSKRATNEQDKQDVGVLIRQTGEDHADGFSEYHVRLVWRDDDWRLVAPPWGDWRSAVTALSSADPADYTSYDAGRA